MTALSDQICHPTLSKGMYPVALCLPLLGKGLNPDGTAIEVAGQPAQCKKDCAFTDWKDICKWRETMSSSVPFWFAFLVVGALTDFTVMSDT